MTSASVHYLAQLKESGVVGLDVNRETEAFYCPAGSCADLCGGWQVTQPQAASAVDAGQVLRHWMNVGGGRFDLGGVC